MSKIIVIGAGPAGLTAAYKLAQAKHSVKIFEASENIGGLSRSFELWGQRVDLGPHRFFSSDRIVNDFWNEVVAGDFTMVNRLTRIYFRNKFFFYPLQPMNAFMNLGPLDVARCIGSYLFAKAFGKKSEDCKTFEDWVSSRFGQRLFQYFFKSYTEKVWGISCSRIDADWAAQRIKKLSLFEAVKSAFLKDKKRKHKTLVDQFAYPKNGTGTVYEKMASAIQKMGGELLLKTPVAEVLTEIRDGDTRATGVRLVDGSVYEADYVISTMPMTLMVKSLKAAPPKVVQACDQLYFRNTVLLYLEVDSAALFPDNWVYIHSPGVTHGRITNFRNWCPSLTRGKSSSILCMEFWCFENDPIWKMPDEEIAALGTSELLKIDLVPQGVKILNDKVIRVPKSYPVYEIGYQEPLETIQKYLGSIRGLYPIGRYGSFKYNNQDHSILMGLLVAREISSGKKENLWAINTDTEYQESSAISEIGLLEVT